MPSRRPFPLLESLSILFWGFGWCEFAQEHLHKENVPHCLQGDAGFQIEQGFLFSPSFFWAPKRQLHSDTWFFNMDWLVYLCGIIVFVIVIWHQIQTALNVKRCLLMRCSVCCLWPHTGPQPVRVVLPLITEWLTLLHITQLDCPARVCVSENTRARIHV